MIRRKIQEHLVTIRMIERKHGCGKQREKMLAGLTKWLFRMSANALKATRD